MGIYRDEVLVVMGPSPTSSADTMRILSILGGDDEDGEDEDGEDEDEAVDS